MSARKKEIEKPIVENIVHSALDELMGDRFDIYAKDVIQDRAIPDARDGLKPVQRRIVYAMWKTGNTIDKPTKKCAHIVGEVMGKYHPHGDSSIYDALVRMSQTWNFRVPLIDFQGNNGSIDGDGPAAYRYTEARLSAISNELIRDLDKDTVRMGLTFDDTEFEPTVLPSRFPNMLVNGTSGIAVGMATEIPPHNLKEVISAIIYRLQHPSCPIETLMRFVPGPDFPTGGIIYQSQGLQDIYLNGKGRIDVASRTEVNDLPDGTQQIIVTEIPFGVNKSSLIYAIDKIRHDKTIAGINEVRDETDKNGIRIAIDLKKGFKAESILAYLMQKTQLRSSYSANMVAIVEGRPQTMNLLSFCDNYIAHQVDVITRRSKFVLAKNEARLLIVLGLIKAASIIDEVIHIIRASEDKPDAQRRLESAYGFTVEQSKAIVEMQLYKLSHTDIAVLEHERDALLADIKELKEILSSEEKLDSVIIADLRQIAKSYGDDRRTEIAEEDTSNRVINKRDLIAREDVMVAVTRDGYVKRSSLASYKGSNGHNGEFPGLKKGDTLVFSGLANTGDFLLMFTTMGSYLYVPIHLLKANKWLEEGLHVNYAVSLDPNEKIVRAYAVRKFRDDLNIVIVTKKGLIKRVKLSAFPVVRFNRPIRAMKLLTDDEVVDAVVTSGNSNLLILSANGLGTFYNENKITITSTTSSGMKAASFHGAPVAAILPFNPEETDKVLLLTDRGCTRVFSISNIEEGDRLSKATTIFKMFKSEVHNLIHAEKLDKREVPLTYKAVLDSGELFDVTYQDAFLTPMDKYAKCNLPLPKKALIATVNNSYGLLIDKSIESFAPPVSEEEEAAIENPLEETPVQSGEQEGGSDVIVKSEEDRPAQKFEQISIFGDDDFDEI